MSQLSPGALQTPPPTEHQELDRILRERDIASVYQPIVELRSGAMVAFEALARGPQGSILHMPEPLFGTAARAGRVAELDWVCRAAALRGALGTALQRPTALFVNIEPVASMAEVPAQFAEVVEGGREQLQVVFEFTERALTDRPAEVLQAVRELRALGAMIALDDVGVDPRSLALMPFVRPDVIKLDMSIIQGPASSQMARTMHAVNAHADAFGAIVLAEGIEHEQHLARALALGATHGQGWLYGKPAPPPSHLVLGPVFEAPARKTGAHPAAPEAATTPYTQVAAVDGRARTASKNILLALSLQLEAQAEDLGPEAVLIASLQSDRHLTDRTRLRYRRLAQKAAFVGVLGEDICAHPAHGVRGGTLSPIDPLNHEWNVCVISPHFAAAMVAQDLGDTGPDMERRFDYRLTYDRATAIQAARTMMTKITAQK